MKLLLNGEEKEFIGTLSIQDLLEQLGIPAGRVACEVNLKIIKRGQYPETVLHEGDTVEIIQAIGGG
jgi:sulfur carrier protein